MIPRFEKQSVNPRLAEADIGDSFQMFVHELLLPEHPHLHRFPGGGKDGGIDLIEESDSCFVVECKVVGEDDKSKIEQRWNIVKNHLEEHLSDPRGPTKGQPQYAPWYSADTPIAEYVFSVSAKFSHAQQRRDLKKTITDYFLDLAGRRPYLAHLGLIKVSILDWNDFCDRLRKRPHSVFRWFPGSRPTGLLPIDEAQNVGTFRAYLNNAKLPYYSLSKHLGNSPPPEGITILDEDNLLARFDSQSVTGLVINGKGGIGKSRLTLELGWKAFNMGWTVMRVQGRLKNGALESLIESLMPEASALLLIDYIETQTDFAELVEYLNLVNDSGIAQIRYVAACRTGYYHQAIAPTGRHQPVDLSPPPGDVALEWFEKYRLETIQQILTLSGIKVVTQHLAVCRDLPILAVFLAYLHTSGRTEQLAELLAEVEFGSWVARRVQSSFPANDVSRDLALLVPLFPMAGSKAASLPSQQFRPLFERLATDGWIEKIVESEAYPNGEWVTAHDVLADQILLSYLRSIHNTAEAFVAELFSLAVSMDCLDSVIVSLQRLSDSPPLNALPWAKLIASAITASTNEWQNVRDFLIRTTLLSESERIGLLYNHKDLWADAERDIPFQNALGWLARWVTITEGAGIPENHKECFLSWILKAAPLADKSNFIINWGLRLAPELLQEIALRWINARPAVFQTHYLMVAWFECNLPTKLVTVPVELWCRKFSQKAHLSFVAKAWLDAKGDPELVKEPIKAWLDVHRTAAEAQFVYNAWLDAKGDPELVKEPIKAWLGVHKTTAEAEFVCSAWLDTKGDPELVKEPIKAWLGVHRTAAEAQFVYKAWLDAKGDPELVKEPIKAWLGVHRTAAEAQFVYKAWLDAKGDPELVKEPIKAWLGVHKTAAKADFVYNAWLKAKGDPELVKESIKAWLAVEANKTGVEADFLFRTWLEAGGEREVVWDSMLSWMEGHWTDESAVYVTKFVAKQPNLPPDTVRHILEWCHTFSTNKDALWRLTSLRNNLFADGVVEDVVLTSEVVLAALLLPEQNLDAIQRGQITTLISYLLALTKSVSVPLRDRIDLIYVKWLRHPLSFGSDPRAHANIQRPIFISRIQLLLDAGFIDVTSDREPLKRFLIWLNTWEIKWKQRTVPILDDLKMRYPNDDLWNIVS